MKKYVIAIFILLLFNLSCVNSNRVSVYSNFNKNTDRFKTSLYLGSYSQNEITDIDSLIKRPSNIKLIYNEMSKVDKDEFTSTSEFRNNISRLIKNIPSSNGYLVFKGAESGAVPYISYDADSSLSKINLMKSYIPSLSKVYKFKTDYVFTVNENVSSSKETGMNVFGVTNTYKLISGNSYDLYFTNADFGLGDVETNSITSNEARELKDNLSIYYIVNLTNNTNKLTHIAYDVDQPMIDTVIANNVKRYIICVELKAIVICNKKTRSIVKTLYVN